MTTDTDLANHALALLGETQITSIANLSDKAARTCALFARPARREVLRMARWNCATRRANLVERLPVPIAGYTRQYTLPAELLRLLEVNGESVRDSAEFFEIEGNLLLADLEAVWIRYIADIPIGSCDPLLQAAMAARLAAKIAIPLSARIEQANAMESLFRLRMSEARHLDAMETHGGENAGWDRLLGRSRTGIARGHRRDPQRLEES